MIRKVPWIRVFSSKWLQIGTASAALLTLASNIRAQEEQKGAGGVDSNLAALKNSDPEVRLTALRDLMTSLDSRIPQAVRPLLKDEGNSVRRLAARAIGSRWWQIPKEEVATYVSALQRNDTTKFQDERNMINRAVGLLTRTYNGNMFARSANKRWVVYERRGHPCLIDIHNGTEELLGWEADEPNPFLFAAIGNPPLVGKTGLPDSVSWHPNKEAVAFLIRADRHIETVWIWQHRVGLQKLEPAKIVALIGGKLAPNSQPDEIFEFLTEISGWKGDELAFKVNSTPYVGSATFFGDLVFDLSKGSLRVVSHHTEQNENRP